MKREDIIDSLEFIEDEFLEETDRIRRGEGTAAESSSVEESGAEEPAEKPAEDMPSGDSGKVVQIRNKNAIIRRWAALAAGFAILVAAAFAFSGILRTRNMSESMKSAEVSAPEEAAGEAAAAEPPEALEQADMAAEETDAEELPAAAEQVNTAEAPAAAEQIDVAEPAAAGQMNAAEEPAETAAADNTDKAEKTAAPAAAASVMMRVTSDAGEVVFLLNDTPAAESLAAQLPLTVDTEPYSDNEIVFQPGEPLDTENGKEGGGSAGYLGYFAPWNNVVMYYGDFEAYQGLYILGEAISGAENIRDIRGTVTIDVDSVYGKDTEAE